MNVKRATLHFHWPAVDFALAVNMLAIMSLEVSVSNIKRLYKEFTKAEGSILYFQLFCRMILQN